MRGSFPVGRVLGIPILVNGSWFASVILIVGLLSLRLFPDNLPGRDAILYWFLGLCGGAVFFLTIIAHELGHCIVARHYGIPVRNITLFIYGGVSQISLEPPGARAELLMALAGPAVSLVIGGALLKFGPLVFPDRTPAALLVEWLGGINLVLGIFNLLPGFPMDGGRVLRSVIWGLSGNLSLATRLAAFLGRVLAFVLMGSGLLTLLQVPGWPLVDYPLLGLSLIFVGLFLNRTAGQTQRQARLLNFLRTYRADQLMDPDVPTIPAEALVRNFIANSPGSRPESAYFVTRDGRVAGLLSRERLQRLPATRWAEVTAAELMIPADRIAPASPQDDGATLLQRMEAEGLPGLPVVSAGNVAGLVTRDALFRLLRGNPRLRLLRL